MPSSKARRYGTRLATSLLVLDAVWLVLVFGRSNEERPDSPRWPMMHGGLKTPWHLAPELGGTSSMVAPTVA